MNVTSQLLNLHSSGISRKNLTLSRVCYFIEQKVFSDMGEVRRLLKSWSKEVCVCLSVILLRIFESNNNYCLELKPCFSLY